MIQVGDQAPDFALESDKGMFALQSLHGAKNAVIIFYPKDNTPG